MKEKMVSLIRNTNVLFYLSFVGIILFWILTSIYGWVDDLFVPYIWQFKDAVVKLFLERNFSFDIGVSIFRVLGAWTLSFIIAVPLALLMASSRISYRLLSPYIDFFRYLPVPVLIPLLILFFGIDETAKIALLFIGTFFQLVLLILDDLQDIPDEYFDLSFTLKYNFFEIQKMKLLAIAPSLWNNSRITMGWAWTYLVIAELIASQDGIGHMIKEAQRFSNTPEIYVGIITMGIIGLGTDFLWKFYFPKVFKYKNIKIK